MKVKKKLTRPVGGGGSEGVMTSYQEKIIVKALQLIIYCIPFACSNWPPCDAFKKDREIIIEELSNLQKEL